MNFPIRGSGISLPNFFNLGAATQPQKRSSPAACSVGLGAESSWEAKNRTQTSADDCRSVTSHPPWVPGFRDQAGEKLPGTVGTGSLERINARCSFLVCGKLLFAVCRPPSAAISYRQQVASGACGCALSSFQRSVGSVKLSRYSRSSALCEPLARESS